MSTNVTLHTGHDVAYFTRGQHRGGCAGAMSYYTAEGEPPGQWAGTGAATLGLRGQVRRLSSSFPLSGGPGLARLDQQFPAGPDVVLVQAADHVRVHLAGQPERCRALSRPLPGRLPGRGVVGHGPGAAAAALTAGEVGHVVARVQGDVS